MTKTNFLKPRFFWFVVVIASALSCSPKAETPIESHRQALSTSNGFYSNGLTTNGLISNGFYSNGFYSNGFYSNGFYSNGFYSNGFYSNGFYSNGFYSNGFWDKGLFSNDTWRVGQTGNAAIPGDTLRSSPYLRELLQYIYSCAMPAKTYDATLDPNNGTLKCSSSDAGADGGSGCDDGYTCSEGTCVVPLVGAIGVGINADDTSWGESGKCDETCQRWVSACVLARTNAYGVHVKISIRAPADAPQKIKDALAVSDQERNGYDAGVGNDASFPPYSLREGAYYGNIFATAPVNPPPSPTLDSSGHVIVADPPPPTVGPDGGLVPYSGPVTGPIASAPVYYACAGPGSNIPQITKRFCSSQGDQVVINVPGMCLGTATQAGACAAEDTDSTSQTFGAIQDCYTGLNATGTFYKEVLTVYLAEPIAVCGNSVCEDDGTATSPETSTSCPSDCHPGTWAKNYAPSLESGFVDDFNHFGSASIRFGMSAVAPDNSVVVAGTHAGDVDLGGGVLPASSDGVGVLVKYNPDGTYAWALRFGGVELQEVNGVTVDPATGNVVVVGLGHYTLTQTATVDLKKVVYTTQYNSVLFYTFASNGDPVYADWQRLLTDPSATSQLQTTRALAVDSNGDLVMSGTYGGEANFNYTPHLPVNNTGTGVYLSKFDMLNGWFSWVIPIGADLESLSVDSAKNIVIVDGADGLEKFSTDGTLLWSKVPTGGTAFSGHFTVAAVDAQNNVYASGYLYDGNDLGGGPITPVRDSLPFLVKYDSNGVYQWASYPKTACSPAGCPVYTDRAPPQVQGVAIGFESSGDVVWAAMGNPYVGGGIDFGVGMFPTYGSNNLFVATYSTAPADAGAVHWAKQFPLILNSSLLSMGIDGNGRVVLGGNYSGSMLADDRLLVTEDPVNATVVNSFLASFGPPPPSDNKPPEIGPETVPLPIVAQATSSAGAVVFYMPPTATDDGYAGVSVVCSPPPNTLFPIGTTAVPSTTVTCTASDPVGNHASKAFTVTVVDRLAPVFLPYADVTVSSTIAGGANVPYPPSSGNPAGPTAIDQVDGTIVPSCPGSGTLFAVGTTPVLCTATDLHGNTSNATFNVIVKGVSVGGSCSTGSQCGTGNCVDGVCCATACGGGDPTDCQACSKAAGGSVDGTCTAVSAGQVCRKSGGSCDVAEACDGSGFACPTDGFQGAGTICRASAGGCDVAETCTGSSAACPNDAVKPSGTVCRAAAAGGCDVAETCTGSSTACPNDVFKSAGTVCQTTANVCQTAAVCSGAGATCPPLGTIPGCAPPVVKVPPNITAEATCSTGAKVTFTVTAKDWHGNTLTPTCSPPSGTTFAIGQKTVTCTAKDASGQIGTASFTVTVKDTKGPVFCGVPRSPITAYATTTSGAKVSYTKPAANDAVDGSRTVTCTLGSGAQFPVNKTTVTCTASDKTGNTSTATFTVWVTYQTPTDGTFFLAPIRSNGSAIFKIGNPLGVRFKLTCPTITNLVAKLAVTKLSTTIQGTTLVTSTDTVADSGLTFHYDSAAKNYVYRWKTSDQTQGTFQLKADLGDGVTHQINVSLKP